MTVTSQNGWPVLTANQCVDITVNGVEFPNGFCEGAVAELFSLFFWEFHQQVEPLHPDWCWGYDRKKISGTDTWSNHASGTAGDANAPHHARGVRGTFTAPQVSAIRALLRRYGRVIYWGGDFSTTVDEMHFEIRGTESQVKATLAKIKGVKLASHTYATLDGHTIAELFLGQNDADFAGAHMIAKAQHLLGVTVDGAYGPETKAAVARLNAVLGNGGSGSSIGLTQWVGLLGLR